MSSQRGNISRTRSQKHKNQIAFDNLRFDKSVKSIKITQTDIAQVCEPCQNVIQWKIKYKKYKPLTQCKTCTRCHQKTIKNAYHIVCIPCSNKLQVCSKCAKKREIVTEALPDKNVQQKEKSELEARVAMLPLRKKQTYRRYIDSLNGVVDMKKDALETEDDYMKYDQLLATQGDRELRHNEFMKLANGKLDELMKNCKLKNDFDFDDFDDDDFDDDDNDDEDDDEDDE